MILSHDRRFIFIHIPKTGGTSFSLAYEARATKTDILVGDTPKAQRRRKRQQALRPTGRLWKHATLSDIEGLVSPDQMRRYFVCTLVRNPWDRCVSYYHWLREQSFEHPAVAKAKTTAFAEFLADPEITQSLRNSQAASYVRAPDGTDCCNAYIRFEHLADDLAPVEEHLGFSLLPLPHENRSARRGTYADQYTPELADHVAEIFADDIARFGYRFDPGAR